DIKNELQQFNYRVLPDQPLPEDTDELLAAIRGYLQQAALSVHLVGRKYGIRPDSEDRSIPHIQYDLATELNKEQLIWFPKDLTPENEQQRRFVDYVRKQPGEWQENKIEDFKSEILKRLRHEFPTDSSGQETESVNVCLFFHEDDALDVRLVFSHLTIQEL